MALAFNTTKIEPSTEGFDKLALLEATENLNQAWMNLTEAQRGMDEVCAIMENIHTSVDLINKFGKDAIPMLNVDGGLEALLQIPENVITAEKAMEGFGEAAKAGWEKFKAIIQKVYEYIKKFFTFVGEKIASLFDWSKSAASKVAAATDEALAKAGEKKVNTEGPAANEGLANFYKFTKLYPFNIVAEVCNDYSRLLDGLDSIVDSAYSSAREIISGESFAGVKDDVSAGYDKVEQTVRVILKQKVENIKTNKLDITYTWPDGEKIPANWVVVSSKSLEGYHPEETTYAALGWSRKPDLEAFLDVFGRCQHKLGKLRGSCEKIQTDMAELFKKKTDAGCSYPELTNTFNLLMKVIHLPLKVEFEQVQLLKATATEVAPLIDDL